MQNNNSERFIAQAASAAYADRSIALLSAEFPVQLLESLASRSQDLIVLTNEATCEMEYCNLNSVIEQAHQPYYQTLFQSLLGFRSEEAIAKWTITDKDDDGNPFTILSYRINGADARKYLHIITGNLKWDGSHNRDSATGLFTRAFCLDRMQEMLAASIRFTVCYLDIDNLRAVNEQYGLSAGDGYITDVVRMIGNSIRREDLFARVGSDEFIILFKSCTDGAIAHKMDAVTQSLRRNAPETDRAPRGLSYCTVRAASPSAITVDQILELCNRRMYERKHFGAL